MFNKIIKQSSLLSYFKAINKYFLKYCLVQSFRFSKCLTYLSGAKTDFFTKVVEENQYFVQSLNKRFDQN